MICVLKNSVPICVVSNWYNYITIYFQQNKFYIDSESTFPEATWMLQSVYYFLSLYSFKFDTNLCTQMSKYVRGEDLSGTLFNTIQIHFDFLWNSIPALERRFNHDSWELKYTCWKTSKLKHIYWKIIQVLSNSFECNIKRIFFKSTNNYCIYKNNFNNNLYLSSNLSSDLRWKLTTTIKTRHRSKYLK